MITKLEEIIQTVQGQPRKKLAVAYAQDSHTLEAVGAAVDMGIVEAILVGDRDEIERVCMADEIDPEKFSVIDQKSDVACVATAVKMIHDGMADILMKGLVSTDKYMRGILDKEFGLLPPKGVLSHVAVLELPMYHKLLLVSDVAVIPYPDLDQKVRITRYLIEAARALGVQKPKVAVVAQSEQMLPKGCRVRLQATPTACCSRRWMRRMLSLRRQTNYAAHRWPGWWSAPNVRAY